MRTSRPVGVFGLLSAALVLVLLPPSGPSEAREVGWNHPDTAAVSGLAAAPPADAILARSPGDGGAGARVLQDGASRFLLANDRIVVALGYGGDDHARFSVLDRARDLWVLPAAASRLNPGDGRTFSLPRDSEPWEGHPPAFHPVDDPALGPGVEVVAPLWVPRAALAAQLRLTLFAGAAHVLYRIEVLQGGPGAMGATFDLLDGEVSEVLTGPSPSSITAYGQLRRKAIASEPPGAFESVGQGKPLFLWSERPGGRSVVLATLDETAGPPQVGLRMNATDSVQVSFVSGAELTAEGLRSPRLFLEFPATADPVEALAGFRRVSGALHPPLPMPSWFRHQWNSWYTYYTGVTEGGLMRQADYISAYLGDLGPWNISIDAGWYVAEGRQGSDWRAVDQEKFPHGLASVTAGLRERGISSILYFSAPYLDDRPKPGNWLGLAGLAGNLAEGLRLVDADALGQGYLLELAHPPVRAYLQSVLEDFYLRHQVDGIAVDGLGTYPRTPATAGLRASVGVTPEVGRQTMEFYRFIHEESMALRPDAYIIAGWHFPLFANPYAHAFWYSDETPAVKAAYPYGGLFDHIDFSIVQQAMWGQRSHMGFLYGNPNSNAVIRWWLEAALALGTQVALGFDLSSLTPEALGRYRERLAQYRPFEGETFVYGEFPPDVFGTRRGDTTFVGILNREDREQSLEVPLGGMGLDPAGEYLGLDVERGSYARVSRALQVTIPASSFRLFVLKSGPGVVWTNSGFEESAEPGRLRVKVSGPTQLSGFADIHLPGAPQSVLVDGSPALSAAFNPQSKVLTVRYDHEQGREISVLLAEAAP